MEKQKIGKNVHGNPTGFKEGPIQYKGHCIDRTKNGYRVSKQSDKSIHTHLKNLAASYRLIDNVVGKRIPTRCGLYYLEPYIRIADDPRHKQKLQDYYDMKVQKGKKQQYYNPMKKKL